MKVFIFFCHTTRWICSSKASARLNSYKNKRNVILTNIPAKVCTNAVESDAQEFCSICSTHIFIEFEGEYEKEESFREKKFKPKDWREFQFVRSLGSTFPLEDILLKSGIFKHATFQENPTCSPSRLQPLEIKDSERHYLPKELEKRPLKVTGMTSIITQLSRWKASFFEKQDSEKGESCYYRTFRMENILLHIGRNLGM